MICILGGSLCPLWVLYGSSVNLLIYVLVKSEYVRFPVGPGYVSISHLVIGFGVVGLCTGGLD